MVYKIENSGTGCAFRRCVLLGLIITVCYLSVPVLAGGPYALTGYHSGGIADESAGSGYNLYGTFVGLEPTISSGSQYTRFIIQGSFWPATSWSKTLILCDFNSDYHVNLEDLLIFVSHWMQTGCSEMNAYCGGADFDENSKVDINDFLVLSGRWQYVEYLMFYDFPLDSDPGWSFDGEWDLGQPLGAGGTEYGYPDPTMGYTGDWVYGVNLAGDYDHTITTGPYYLNAGPFDCSEHYNVFLRFARWLNTDKPGYVASKIEMSPEGSVWYTIWEHDWNEFIMDGNWQIEDYDLGSIADNQQAVYIRWSYEIVDGNQAYPFSGWNIDDIELWGNPSL